MSARMVRVDPDDAAQVEQLARVLDGSMSGDGASPDDIVGGEPAWMMWKPEAGAVLLALSDQNDAVATEAERLTAAHWCDLLGYEVLDPDGWRRDGLTWQAPITRDDFEARFAQSTGRRVPTTHDLRRRVAELEAMVGAIRTVLNGAER